MPYAGNRKIDKFNTAFLSIKFISMTSQEMYLPCFREKESDMAIAASYTMHLYCDCRQCTEGVYPVPDFGEYIGTSWSGCAKEARKDGWRISKDKTRTFAPGHKVLRINT